MASDNPQSIRITVKRAPLKCTRVNHMFPKGSMRSSILIGKLADLLGAEAGVLEFLLELRMSMVPRSAEQAQTARACSPLHCGLLTVPAF